MALREATFDASLQNAPVNWYNQRAVGSDWAADPNNPNTSTTLLLSPDIKGDIDMSFPQQFTDMAFMMSLKKRTVNSFEYFRMEQPWIHVPIGVRTNTAGVSLSAATVVQQTIPIPDSSIPYIRVGDKVIYPDSIGTNGLVASMVTTAGSGSITVNSWRGVALPAVTTADTLINAGPMGADGFSTIYSTTTTDVIKYQNVMEYSRAFAYRYDRFQLDEWKRQGTTNYIELQLKNSYLRAMTTLQAKLFMSRKGGTTMPDGTSTTASTSGFLEQMATAGVTTQTVPASMAVDAMREIVFDTSLTSGGTKIIMGTRRNLQYIGMNQKADKVRYTPENTSWNMDIYQYDYFGHQCILVPMDQWMDPGLYGTQLKNDLLIMNKEDMYINQYGSQPMVSMKHNLLNQQEDPGNLFNFELAWFETLMGVELVRPWATGRLRLA